MTAKGYPENLGFSSPGQGRAATFVKEERIMSTRQEKLAKLRRALAKCRGIPDVHAGRTDADYLFRKRVSAAIDLLLAWLDFELN